MVIVPPGGFAGFAQMTSSSKNILSRGVKGGGTRRRSKGRKRKSSGLRKYRVKSKKVVLVSRKRGGVKRLVKGSAAAKAYMAKIRRKRKRG